MLSRYMRGTGLALWLVFSGWAQETDPSPAEPAKPLLENTGKPIAVPFRCTDDDMQWAGLSCSDREPCPVYLELTGAESSGSRIFAAGNLHTDTVTLYSILLGSEDSGRTWRELYERIRGAGLDRIQFSDLANGWISGQTLVPLPQDPFLLLTADGGQNWRMQPIFSESHPGSIQQFFFRSKNEGSLIVDQGEGSGNERYALYESPNAGESWLLKQMSGVPIRLPRPAGEASWRVQADRATRAFRIERRALDKWTSVVSFLVNIGACRPTSLDVPAPEEQSQPAAPATPRETPRKRPRR